MSYCVPPPTKPLINKDIFSRPILDSLAAGSRQKKLSDRDVGLLALALGVYLYPTTTPVGMWKSGGGWASRWAGVFLPVHRLVHALEPRSARQGRFPHIHRAHSKAAWMPPKKASAMDGGLLLRQFAKFRQTAKGGASRCFLSKSKRKRSALASRAGRKSKSPPGPGRR